MKSRIMLLLGLIFVLAVGADVLLAQADEPAPGGRGNFREKLLKEFDKDGDGRLGEDERAAAKKAWQERRGQKGGAPGKRLLEQFDENKDGKLDETERAKAREAMKARRGAEGRPRGSGALAIFANLDKDGDCTLSEAEINAAMEARLARMAKMAKDRGRDLPADKLAQIKEQFAQRFAKVEADAKKPFNEDGQGDLTDPELAKMKAAIAKLKEARKQAFQKRWENLPAEQKERLLEKFDENDNGKLDPDEAKKAHEAMRSRRGPRRGREGGPGDKPGPRPGGRRRRPQEKE